MKTLLFFESAAQSVPQNTAWYLADLGEYLGKQKLYERQAHYGRKRVLPLKEGNN